MSSINITDIVEILSRAELPPIEKVVILGRDPKISPVPQGLCTSVEAALSRDYPNGLYSHQAAAIQQILDGRDICLATPTASGKSLVFMAAAAELTLREQSARVLALYPVRALIQDQLAKWKQFLDPIGTTVGFIDGSVATESRPNILASSQVVAMTPDVAHAWLMSHLGTPDVTSFLQGLRLVILDEAHVYDGAFGTNMAYFLRRLALTSAPYRLICSTATVGAPQQFIQQLTGREMLVLDDDDDGSALFRKTLLRVESSAKGGFDRIVQLLSGLAKYGRARFLAFGDSRKMVELIVGAILRESVRESDGKEDETDKLPNGEDFRGWPKLEHVLPYRAGYETTDREKIQKALTDGSLAGVVSTSALELGLDIGDLDVVVLLNTPPTVKSFRQRIGRAGRRRDAVCILVDDHGVMAPLRQYVDRSPEPGWLYLDNRYIQYANALCAAVEFQTVGFASATHLDFGGLPDTFPRLLENELNPTAAVESDLYALKQRAQANPHYEFPMRSAAEPNFEVEGPFGKKLGTLSYSQALREAYPGAVYYYMAHPFRIRSLEYKKGLIKASKAKRFTTKPVTDTMAFPDFRNGLIRAWKSSDGFVAEVELQVNERVKGFVEQRGPNKLPVHEYGSGSPYSQKSLARLFRTTGVCWAFPSKLDRSPAVADLLMQAFAFTCGIHERDLGTAFFYSNEGPFSSSDQVKGTVILDTTNGSLRLTERLARDFAKIIDSAVSYTNADSMVRSELEALRQLVNELEPVASGSMPVSVAAEGDWIRVIDREQPAIYLSGEAPAEVAVLDFRYTPHGLMYELKPLQDSGYSMIVGKGKLGTEKTITKNAPGRWMVIASVVQALSGRTRMVRYNVVTGEEAPDV